ncbi:MAG: hypothetical protein ABGX83_04245 [Nitrospira sp.]|nr:hypothetical protein [Candidatus Manganitrophaceae bacterium]HIL34704.1 hypothetical protein [Candidatus Manganitrophaceae bacterium]
MKTTSKFLPSSGPEKRLRVIPFYTGDQTLEEVLRHPSSLKLLWIEILLNRDFSWKVYLGRPEVQAAHEKACIWYGHFKTMVESRIGASSLEARPGKIDEKEYRKLVEALNFVAS